MGEGGDLVVDLAEPARRCLLESLVLVQRGRRSTSSCLKDVEGGAGTLAHGGARRHRDHGGRVDEQDPR